MERIGHALPDTSVLAYAILMRPSNVNDPEIMWPKCKARSVLYSLELYFSIRVRWYKNVGCITAMYCTTVAMAYGSKYQ